MWSILILMPVSLVKRWPISASFLSEAGAKLFQQRYEISRCWPRAGGTRAARTPASPAPVVVARKRRRLIGSMAPPALVAPGPGVGNGEGSVDDARHLSRGRRRAIELGRLVLRGADRP